MNPKLTALTELEAERTKTIDELERARQSSYNAITKARTLLNIPLSKTRYVAFDFAYGELVISFDNAGHLTIAEARMVAQKILEMTEE